MNDKPYILILDFIKKENRDSIFLADFLKKEGFLVERPEDVRRFIKSIDFVNNLPGAILYPHPFDELYFQEMLSAFDFYNAPIFNSLSSIRMASDRLWLKIQLYRNNLPTPDFFYGYPARFNKSWKRKVLKVRNGEDNLVMLADNRIHSHDRLVFLEELVFLPKGYVDTVFVVGDDIFQFAKNDTLGLYPCQDLNGEKKLESNLADMARQVGALTNLTFYNVDFIDGKIIDVNAFPNIFLERSFSGISGFFKKFFAEKKLKRLM